MALSLVILIGLFVWPGWLVSIPRRGFMALSRRPCPSQPSHPRVSIPRRGFMALSLGGTSGSTPTAIGFNPPQGIHGVVTCRPAPGDLVGCRKFQSPAGDSWRCHNEPASLLTLWLSQGFNPPQGIHGVVTSMPLCGSRANRLRTFQSPAGDSWRCHLVLAAIVTVVAVTFQSPAGDSWRCHTPLGALSATFAIRWMPTVSIPRRGFMALSLARHPPLSGSARFQSPAGDSWRCHDPLHDGVPPRFPRFNPPQGIHGVVTHPGRGHRHRHGICFNPPQGIHGVVTCWCWPQSPRSWWRFNPPQGIHGVVTAILADILVSLRLYPDIQGLAALLRPLFRPQVGEERGVEHRWAARETRGCSIPPLAGWRTSRQAPQTLTSGPLSHRAAPRARLPPRSQAG